MKKQLPALGEVPSPKMTRAEKAVSAREQTCRNEIQASLKKHRCALMIDSQFRVGAIPKA